MDSGLTHQQQQQRQRQRNDVDEALQRQLDGPAPDLAGLEEGQLSGERATGLQGHLGNQAILNLLDRLDRNAADIDALDQEEETEQEVSLELDQNEDLAADAELRNLHGGGDGGGGAVPVDNPWEVGVLFGGEDDPEAPTKPKTRRRRRRRQGPVQDILDEELPEEDVPPPAATEAMISALKTSEDVPTERWGDSIFEAVEQPLLSLEHLVGRSLDPDLLEVDVGTDDPLHRPTAIGRFLSEGRGDLTFASLLSGPASGLLSEATGFPGAAARLATLAICAEIEEGGQRETDRATALAMCAQAWPRALAAARISAQESRLHAPVIAARALEQKSLPSDPRATMPPPSLLGGRALKSCIPLGYIPPVPALRLPPPPTTRDLDDEALNAVDAVLARFTGGEDPAALPPPPVLSQEMVSPLLSAANILMNSLGRAQVEFAAAGVAVRMVHTGAPIRATLNTADKALRQMARGVVLAARQLERLRGQHLSIAQEPAERAAQAMQSTNEALISLRTWGFATLAGALDAQPLKPVSAGTVAP